MSGEEPVYYGRDDERDTPARNGTHNAGEDDKTALSENSGVTASRRHGSTLGRHYGGSNIGSEVDIDANEVLREGNHARCVEDN